ncbi:MAG TPA: hypothetical protein VFC74_04110 [Oscillospiraceae bacterium]|nr:hypothetical protein [Oscillospiraceae bacterium]
MQFKGPLLVVKDINLATSRLDLRVLVAAEQVLAYYQRNQEFLAPWEAVKEEEFFTLTYQQDQLQNELHSMREGRLFKVWLFFNEGQEIIG